MSKELQLLLLFVIIVPILILGALFSINTFSKPQKEDVSISSLVLDPSPTVPEEVSTKDPEVTTFRLYNNDPYNFTLTVPSDWKEADYSKTRPGGGTLIAFSPSPLPCDSCTYFHDGYLSVRIYNQKTSPQEYAVYMKASQSVGKSKEYQPVLLDNKKGIFSEHNLFIENNGWVYEFVFDKDNGKAKITESPLFQKIVTSVKFTNIVFDQ